MIIQVSEKVWYILKIDMYQKKINLYSSRNSFKNCSMVSSKKLPYYKMSTEWKNLFLKPCIRYVEGSRDRGIDDPDLPLNLGSKIRSRSQFKFGIRSDRNRSEVIEIDRDREKIVDRQCTAKNLLKFLLAKKNCIL